MTKISEPMKSIIELIYNNFINNGIFPNFLLNSNNKFWNLSKQHLIKDIFWILHISITFIYKNISPQKIKFKLIKFENLVLLCLYANDKWISIGFQSCGNEMCWTKWRRKHWTILIDLFIYIFEIDFISIIWCPQIHLNFKFTFISRYNIFINSHGNFYILLYMTI